MANPLFPWYDKLEKIVAPTEPAANLALWIILAIIAVVLLKGTPAMKAALVVWIISP